MRLIALGWVVALALGACGSGGTSSGGASAFEGEWNLVEGTGIRDDTLSKRPIVLTLEGSRLSGRAACNHFDGTAEIDGSSFLIGPVSWTAMGCPPPAMATDDKFRLALGAVDTIRRQDEQMVLEGSDTTLVFDFVPPDSDASLSNTRWRFDGFTEGTGPGALVGFAGAGSLVLHDDGTLEGSTGCRDFSGKWRESGDHIEVSDFSAKGECEGGDGSQDERIIFVLRDAFRATIEGAEMNVTHLTDDVALLYVAR